MDAPGLIPSLIGAPLVAEDHRVAGTVEDLLVCAGSGRPLWLLVRLHDCALPYTLVPATRMISCATGIAVPYDEAVVRAAPIRLAAPAAVTREHTSRLSRHYGLRVTHLAEAQPLHGARAPLALAS